MGQPFVCFVQSSPPQLPLALITWPTPSFFLILGNSSASGVFYFIKWSELLRPQVPGCVDQAESFGLDSHGRHGAQWLKALAWSPIDLGSVFPPALHSLVAPAAFIKWTHWANAPYRSWGLTKEKQLKSLTQCLLIGNVQWKRALFFKNWVTLIPLLLSSGKIHLGGCIVSVIPLFIQQTHIGAFRDKPCARYWG